MHFSSWKYFFIRVVIPTLIALYALFCGSYSSCYLEYFWIVLAVSFELYFWFFISASFEKLCSEALSFMSFLNISFNKALSLMSCWFFFECDFLRKPERACPTFIEYIKRFHSSRLHFVFIFFIWSFLKNCFFKLFFAFRSGCTGRKNALNFDFSSLKNLNILSCLQSWS